MADEDPAKPATPVRSAVPSSSAVRRSDEAPNLMDFPQIQTNTLRTPSGPTVTTNNARLLSNPTLRLCPFLVSTRFAVRLHLFFTAPKGPYPALLGSASANTLGLSSYRSRYPRWRSCRE